MPILRLRFYEELNDFLSPGHRKREFEWHCPEDATVKHVIEALGVPHPEVDLILVDGSPVDFSHRIRSGERLSVYPRFESFDISPLVRLRPRPLRDVRFLADGQVAALARYLRLLGFDTRLREAWTTSELLLFAQSDRRIILTRSRRLLMHRQVTHGIYLRAQAPRRQCREVLERLHLCGEAKPFSRCLCCNDPLEEIESRNVAARIPPDVLRRFTRLRHCPRCDRVYWAGSHYRRMERLVGELLRG